MKASRGLTADEVWAKVREFASQAREKRRPVYTLQRRVRNFITAVKDRSIWRDSEEGVTNSSRVTHSMIARTWDRLRAHGRTTTPEGVLYFAPALLHAALPGLTEYLGDGELALRHDPRAAAAKARRAARGSPPGSASSGGGGEGDLHQQLRKYIYENPSAAMAGLGGGEWRCVADEFAFPSGDRVDIVLRDPEGRFVMVEVEPQIQPDNRVPWAQAAKYRTLWSIFEGAPLGHIRSVVAAPALPRGIAKKMLGQHRIEGVAVSLP